jgi:hypothetical protein
MATLILPQIPYPHIAPAVTANELPLIRMNHDIVDGHPVRVVPLDGALPCVPYLNRAVLGAGYHPFALAVEGDACDVARVAVESQDRVWVRRFDVIEFYRVVPGRGEVALVRGDAEPVYLGVGVWDCARADAREGFPESLGESSVLCFGGERERGKVIPNRVIVPSYGV